MESFLDEDERFQNFVMMTFDDESDTSQQLPRDRLLKSLVAVYDLIAAVLPPAGRRLITRCAAWRLAAGWPRCGGMARLSRGA